ncbi:MAG: DUF4827 domain-containing protein [Phocaeicola sp.]
MKNLRILLGAVMAFGLAFQACDSSKTYAEMKEDEREAIQRFIEKENIKVISLETFQAQDSTTNVADNEYVLFPDNGVYMQVLERGTGPVLEDGNFGLLARYVEERLNTDGTRDTISLNTIANYYPHPDEFTLTISGRNYYGSFSSASAMSGYSTAVPTGWLIPFRYIKTGREIAGRAKVKLIVPHNVGQADASSSVYPCYYNITFQLDR